MAENRQPEPSKVAAPPSAAGAAKGAAANAGWNSFATVWGLAIGFFLAPVLIHNIGTAGYGVLLLVWSITGILSITSLGLGEGTLRYIAYYHADGDIESVNRILRSTLSLFVVIGTLVTAVLAIAAPTIVTWLNIPPDQHRLVAWLVRLTGVVFSLTIITNAIGCVPRALHRWDIPSKISIGISVLRGGGYIVLALTGFGILHIVLWDLLVSAMSFSMITAAAKRLLPQVRLLPSFSLAGVREIFGYSVFSFLTWAFHTLHRESGKLLVARFLGATPVAYLGAPDNLSQRIHGVVSSGAEALMPRFSANRDRGAARGLFWNSTWVALALSLVLFVPFFILIPDFLRLWISPEFARESATVGQLLALYLIWQGAFAPAATYYRGTGRPWFVSLVILLALLITITVSIFLIPAYGVRGAAMAYLLGSAAPFLGVVIGGIYAFGRSALRSLLRVVALPVVAAAGAGALGLLIRGLFGELTWVELLAQGVLLSFLTAVLVVGGDLLLGGENAPSRQALQSAAKSRRFGALIRLIPLRRAG